MTSNRSASLNRRSMITLTGAGLGALATGLGVRSTPAAAAADSLFQYCLNTATIRSHNLSLDKELDVAAQAGYSSVEPWMEKIGRYAEGGRTLKDLKKKLEDLNLTVESAIGFARWIAEDEEARNQGLEQLKREMDMLAQIGAKRIAAPPAGATGPDRLDLFRAAERYRAILDIGDGIGVIPQLEIWGPSKNLSRLGEAAFVLAEAAHPKACLLPDIYHIYKGGSDHAGLDVLAPNVIQVFHMNDYPADPPRDTIGDRDRVMPGDGIAPTPRVLKSLQAKGAPVVLSLELFDPRLAQRDALDVAQEGIRKMKAQVATISS